MTEKAILAGGCFWGMEELFRELPGVLETRVGYMGGTLENPTYEDICKGDAGHAEAVEIIFDPDQVQFRDLLVFFFQIHDPCTFNKQGKYTGSKYRSAVFAQDKSQETEAKDLMQQIEKTRIFEAPLSTQVESADHFYEAPARHQKYLKNNPLAYNCHYVREDLDFSKIAA